MDRENMFKIIQIDLSDDTLVTHAPTSTTATLQPPKGFVYQVLNIYCLIPIPAGGTAGTHRLTQRYQNQHTASFLGYLDSVFGTTIVIIGYSMNATTEVPSGSRNQEEFIRFLKCTHDQPIDFIYKNSTDADQVGTRTLVITVMKYREAI